VSDKRLLEQIIYNIVHNAIKYSYWGTKIKMDCKRSMDSKEDKQILSITDYGVGFDKDEDIYALYYRSPNIKQVVDGSGIGLFIVKRISELLGFEVRHRCEHISDYNVGLINAYLERVFVIYSKDTELNERLKQEKKDLSNKNYPMYLMTNNMVPKVKLEEKEIIDMILMKTYKVTFEVII
jgi:hypothetical protein